MSLLGLVVLGMLSGGPVGLGECHAVFAAAPSSGAGDDVTTGTDEGTGESVSAETIRMALYARSEGEIPEVLFSAVGSVLAEVGDRASFDMGFQPFVEAGEMDGLLYWKAGPDSPDRDRQEELRRNLVVLCAFEHLGAGFFPVHHCVALGTGDWEGQWETCAEDAGVAKAAWDAAQACIDGPQGKKLFLESAQRNRLAGMAYRSGLVVGSQVLENDLYSVTPQKLLAVVCTEFAGNPPDACTRGIAAVPITLTVIEDSRCTDPRCKVGDDIFELFRKTFPGLTGERLQFTSKEGQDAYDKCGLRLLPGYVFSASVVKDPSYSEVAGRLRKCPRSNDLYFRWWQSHDPTREICDNGVDDDGRGGIDCQDLDCAEALICRPEIPGRLDIFVTVDGSLRDVLPPLRRLLDRFGSDIEVTFHYLAQEDAGGIWAYAGDQHLRHAARLLCAQATSKPVSMKFLDCLFEHFPRNDDVEDPGDYWKECAAGAGLDVAELEQCAKGEKALKLLRQEIWLAQRLGQVTAHRDWLMNNKYLVHETKPTDQELSFYWGPELPWLFENICRLNPGLKGCETPWPEESRE